MKTYGVGILGCGAVWKNHHYAFEKSDRIKCVTVFDPATDRAQEAGKLTGARVAESADDLLNDPNVDIVAILTPVFTHVELVEKGAAAGKHFMLEKPLAKDVADGQRIVDAIDNAGVKCYHPTIRALSSDLFATLKKWTAPDGEVGPVKAAFYRLMGMPYAPSAWLLDRKNCFPPAEYDPHVFDTFLALTGDEPETVYCRAGNYCRPFDQDDVTSIHVDFKGKRHLQFDVHWVIEPTWKCGAWINFEIICERGMIKHDWFSATWYTSEAQGTFDSARRDTGGNRWDHYHELIEAIETDKPISPNHHDGLKYVRIQDAAMQSAKLGQRVTL